MYFNCFQKMLKYRDGESLQPDELLLYAMVKLTASPLSNASINTLLQEQKTEVVKWNVQILCKTLSSIFQLPYKKKDLYMYFCLMKKAPGIDNPSQIGFFNGLPRIDVFAPYTEVYLVKCAYTLTMLLNGDDKRSLEIAIEARDLCRDIAAGKTVNSKQATCILFGELWINPVQCAPWKYDQQDDELVLWRPHISKPYQTDKVRKVCC